MTGQTVENAIALDGRAVDPAALATELGAAGIPAVGCGVSGDLLWMFDDAGAVIEPTPASESVVAAHVPPPRVVEHAGTRPVDAVIRTTDDNPYEVFRFATAPKHVYRATLAMMAIDATSGAARDSEVRLVFKRTTTALAQVGASTVLSNAQDAAASSWRIVPTVDGTDLVISVAGAAGRSVDWLLTGSVGAYAPDGLEG